jgi:hypothetical protein
MSSETFQTYKHSGKFGVHGPILAIVAALVLGWPLGIAYAYLIRWIPLVYVNFFATIGYGVLFGVITAMLLKIAKVRNNAIAWLTSMVVGFIAWYFAWNGFFFALIKDSPWFYWPAEIFRGMQLVYPEGTWSMRSGAPVSGIELGIIWLIEACGIIGFATMVGIGIVTKTPYCEESQCWLDKTKNIDTLGPFVDPTHRAAFAAGDLSPLTAARPKVPGTENFTRLTLKYSPNCNIFYTVRIQDATITTDKNGNPKTNLKSITKDLVLPHSMFDLITRFENFKGGFQGGAVPTAPPTSAAGAS